MQKCTLWQPIHLDPNTHIASYFQVCSHHHINNIFHKLEFGENKFNIYLATPGECLHMHQLDLAKRAVESFKHFVMGSFSKSSSRKGKRTEALVSIGKIAQGYGAAIIRNSDQDFPRTKYTTPILMPTKEEGNDYAGILLCIIVSLVWRQGSNELLKKSHIYQESIDNLISTLQLIIGTEEFLTALRVRHCFSYTRNSRLIFIVHRHVIKQHK